MCDLAGEEKKRLKIEVLKEIMCVCLCVCVRVKTTEPPLPKSSRSFLPQKNELPNMKLYRNSVCKGVRKLKKVIAYPNGSFFCICMLLNLQNVTILCNILKWEDSSEGS